jgi:hypothetical protein
VLLPAAKCAEIIAEASPSNLRWLSLIDKGRVRFRTPLVPPPGSDDCQRSYIGSGLGPYPAGKGPTDVDFQPRCHICSVHRQRLPIKKPPRMPDTRTTHWPGCILASFKRRTALKRIMTIGLVAASLAACTATEQGAGIGAATGAVIGGAATGNVRGAAVGAAVGGVSGALIGSVAEQPGRCYYRDRYGRRYVDRC